MAGAGLIENPDIGELKNTALTLEMRHYDEEIAPLATLFENDDCSGKSYVIDRYGTTTRVDRALRKRIPVVIPKSMRVPKDHTVTFYSNSYFYGDKVASVTGVHEMEEMHCYTWESSWDQAMSIKICSGSVC